MVVDMIMYLNIDIDIIIDDLNSILYFLIS
jgi:hypothetical protein